MADMTLLTWLTRHGRHDTADTADTTWPTRVRRNARAQARTKHIIYYDVLWIYVVCLWGAGGGDSQLGEDEVDEARGDGVELVQGVVGIGMPATALLGVLEMP